MKFGLLYLQNVGVEAFEDAKGFRVGIHGFSVCAPSIVRSGPEVRKCWPLGRDITGPDNGEGCFVDCICGFELPGSINFR